MTDRALKRRGGPWVGDERARILFEAAARRSFGRLRRRPVEFSGERYVEYPLAIEIPDYGLHQVRILFRSDLSTVGEPVVLTDRPATSPHRHHDTNSLCMWHKDDPSSARWTSREGLDRLVDYIWRHLYREHYWHENHVWLGPEHEHGVQKKPDEEVC